MRLAKYLKEKSESIDVYRESLSKRLEPQIRDLSVSINRKFVENLPVGLVARLGAAFEREPEAPFNVDPKVEVVYNRLIKMCGSETHVGEWFDINQERIDQFAKTTEDYQWIHTDTERARRDSPYRSTVAQGFLILALLPKLGEVEAYMVKEFPETRLVINCGLDRAQFHSPVRAGSSIRSRTELLKVTRLKRSVEIVNKISVEINHSSRLACVAESVFRVYL